MSGSGLVLISLVIRLKVIFCTVCVDVVGKPIILVPDARF